MKKGLGFVLNPHELKGNFYVYKLRSTMSSDIMYVGMTNHPSRRLSQHAKDFKRQEKYLWLKDVLDATAAILMDIVAVFDTKDAALEAEDRLIKELTPVFNKIIKKHCLVLDLKTNKIAKYESHNSACLAIGVWDGNFGANVNLGRYIMSEVDDFEDQIRRLATLKIKFPDGSIKYAVTYPHASWIIGCCETAINHNLNGRLKTVKGCLIARVDGDFGEVPNYGKRVRCINDGKEFKVLKEAATFYKVDHSCITKVCKGKRKQVKGLKFEYV